MIFQGNDLDIQCIHALSRGFICNHSLETVDLRNTRITNNCGEYLIDVINQRFEPLRIIADQNFITLGVVRKLDLAYQQKLKNNNLILEDYQNSIKIKYFNNMLSVWSSPKMYELIDALAREHIEEITRDPEGAVEFFMEIYNVIYHKNNTMDIQLPGNSKIIDLRRKQIEINSETGVFSCYVGGWKCVYKEIDLLQVTDSINTIERDLKIIEELSHSNITRYLFHDRQGEKFRIFYTPHSSTLKECLNPDRDFTLVARGEELSEEHIKFYCKQLSKGLSLLHENKIIHRDLKSSTIYVRRVDYLSNRVVLVIGDYDYSKKLLSRAMRGNINAIRWLAPEVLKDDSSSFAVDIWSLGLVIYELLTLNTPYFDINPLEITSHIKLGNRPTTPKKNPRIQVHYPFV